MTHCESCDSPPYFQHLPAPTNYPICKAMLINQVLIDSVLRTIYLIIILIVTSLFILLFMFVLSNLNEIIVLCISNYYLCKGTLYCFN
jgi:hypothetical protein